MADERGSAGVPAVVFQFRIEIFSTVGRGALISFLKTISKNRAYTVVLSTVILRSVYT